MDEETKQILQLAADEINQLRRQNEVLLAKVETMEFFKVVLYSQPAQRLESAGEDIVWKIRTYIAKNA